MKCTDCIHWEPCFDMGFVLDPVYGGVPCHSFEYKSDFVKVVRCEDCKWYEKGKSYTPYCNNVKNLFEEMEPDDYCSYGKRREEDD